MKAFYNITQKIEDSLKEDAFVNTVTYGDIFKIDLTKQGIFPLSHFFVSGIQPAGPILTISISLLCMDILDYSKADTVDEFIGNDNEHDIQNTQLAVILRLIERLSRGDLYSDLYHLETVGLIEPFTDSYDNNLAGMAVTFDVQIENTMTIC